MQGKEEVLGRYGLQPDQVELGDVLSGDGASGIIRNGILHGSGGKREVAVKLLPMGGATEKEIDSILQEAVALARASESCHYACKLLGMCRKDEHFCLVMKKYAGSLSRKLDSYADRLAPLREVERWMVELCQAVAEMHQEARIVLHDLKPANVLLGNYGELVLADFGIAHIVQTTVRTQATAAGSLRGTVPYMSPEALGAENLGRPGMPSDIWSLGCTMYEMLTGKEPWAGSYGIPQIMMNVVFQRRIPNFAGLEQRIGPFVEVLEACFRFSPTSRPTAHEVLAAVKANCQLQYAHFYEPNQSVPKEESTAQSAMNGVVGRGGQPTLSESCPAELRVKTEDCGHPDRESMGLGNLAPQQVSASVARNPDRGSVIPPQSASYTPNGSALGKGSRNPQVQSHGQGVETIHSKSQWDVKLMEAGQCSVLVIFAASWCGPCKHIAPVFRALSLEYRSIIFLEVDTDKVPEVAISAEVDAIPAFHVYQRGNKVDSTVGAQTDKLGNMVRRYAS